MHLNVTHTTLSIFSFLLIMYCLVMLHIHCVTQTFILFDFHLSSYLPKPAVSSLRTRIMLYPLLWPPQNLDCIGITTYYEFQINEKMWYFSYKEIPWAKNKNKKKNEKKHFPQLILFLLEPSDKNLLDGLCNCWSACGPHRYAKSSIVLPGGDFLWFSLHIGYHHKQNYVKSSSKI